MLDLSCYLVGVCTSEGKTEPLIAHFVFQTQCQVNIDLIGLKILTNHFSVLLSVNKGYWPPSLQNATIRHNTTI